METSSTYQSIMRRIAALLFALAAIVALSLFIAPASAWAEGPWADEKLGQLYEEVEAADEAYTSAQKAYDDAQSEYDAALLPLPNIQSQVSFYASLLNSYRDYEAEIANAKTEEEAQEARVAFESFCEMAAAELGISKDQVNEGAIDDFLAEAEGIFQDTRKQADAKKAARDALLPGLNDAKDAYEAAKDAYYDYEALPESTLTFDLGGGALGSETGVITRISKAGDVVGLPDAPTKDGYTFKFWKGSEYAAGAEYTVEGDHSFTAEWEKDAEPLDDESAKPEKSDTTKPAIAATGDDAGMLAIPISIVGGIALIALIGAALRRRVA